MTSIITGKIFDIKKYAIHDGPGIRTTVFLKGCPLSCGWCHNPEGFQKASKVIYHSNRCIGCGDCLETCPAGAISVSSIGCVTDNRLCTACGQCVDICSANARQMAEHLLVRVAGYSDYFVDLDRDHQEEIIARTENCCI